MGQEVEGEVMGEDYKGYILKITGGNDQQGFAMKQGIMKNGRARILFKKKGSLFNPKRTGYRRRRSVRGCITGPDLAVISLKIMKKGDKEIEGCADKEMPNRLFKKRKNKIAAVFGLDRKKVMKREKLQRFKTSKEDAAKYEKLISQYVKEKKAARAVENKAAAAAATETKK